MSLVTGKKLQSIGSKIIRVDINILVTMIICLLFQEVMQMLLRRTVESKTCWSSWDDATVNKHWILKSQVLENMKKCSGQTSGGHDPSLLLPTAAETPRLCLRPPCQDSWVCLTRWFLSRRMRIWSSENKVDENQENIVLDSNKNLDHPPSILMVFILIYLFRAHTVHLQT